MTAPPGHAPTINGITGTRTNAETKRHLAGRIVRCMKARGMQPQGWQVRSMLVTLLANEDVPTDEQIVLAWMRAPWHRKPTVRRHQVGDPGWRTRS